MAPLVATLLFPLLLVTTSIAGEPVARAIVNDEGLVVACWQGSAIPAEGCSDDAMAVGIVPPKPGPVRLVTWKFSGTSEKDFTPCTHLKVTKGPSDPTISDTGRVVMAVDSDSLIERLATYLEVPTVDISTAVEIDLVGDGKSVTLFAGRFDSQPSPGLIEFYRQVMPESIPEVVPHTIVGVSGTRTNGEDVPLVLQKGEVHLAAYGRGGELLGFTDFDGDGTLEVVVGERSDHFYSWRIFRVERTNTIMMSQTGCGW